MVVGVFPALKLGVLFIKQISKPLAKIIINQAKSHEVFRNYFIIPPAQFYHWAEVKGKMYVMNLGKPTKVAKLNEAMAIELGANLMGEVIIFSVAGACLILEYNRQQQKETKKEQARQEQLEKFTSDIQALFETVTKQESEIKYLNTVVDELNKKTKVKLPPKSTIVSNKINDKDSKDVKDIEKESKDAKTEKEPSNNNNNVNNAQVKINENDRKSVVERAIGYYENDLKKDKSS